NTPGRTRISGASMSARRREVDVGLVIDWAIGVSSRQTPGGAIFRHGASHCRLRVYQHRRMIGSSVVMRATMGFAFAWRSFHLNLATIRRRRSKVSARVELQPQTNFRRSPMKFFVRCAAALAPLAFTLSAAADVV